MFCAMKYPFVLSKKTPGVSEHLSMASNRRRHRLSVSASRGFRVYRTVVCRFIVEFAFCSGQLQIVIFYYCDHSEWFIYSGIFQREEVYDVVHYTLKRLTGASAIMEFGLSEFHTRKSFRQSYSASRHNDLLLLLLAVTAAAIVRVSISFVFFCSIGSV